MRFISRGRALMVGAVTAASLTGLVALSGPATAGSAVRFGTLTTKYTCAVPVLGNQTFGVVVKGTTPLSVAPGAAVTMTSVSYVVTIPASLVNEAYGFGARTASGTATVLTVNASDSKVASENAAGSAGLKFGPITLVQNKNLVVHLPYPSGTVKVAGFVANTKGTMTFTSGNATLIVTLAPLVSNQTVTCTPATGSPTTISHTTVT